MTQAIVDAFNAWYAEVLAKTKGQTPKGTIAGALVVLDRLKDRLSLDINDHTAAGGSQIIGASGSAVAKILARFGETRPFAKEGGRTNRGLRGDIDKMLALLGAYGIKDLTEMGRFELLTDLQQILVSRVQDFFNAKRLEIEFDRRKTARQTIADLLSLAGQSNKRGAVAQYIVGAKLELRFPNLTVGNESYSTADDQLGRSGDFELADTVFHVTVAPQPAVYEKCKRNLTAGKRVYLLVPDDIVIGARQIVRMTMDGLVSVESIESFVGQNVDELAGFSESDFRSSLRELFETYNRRVDAAENDKSNMIEIPSNL